MLRQRHRSVTQEAAITRLVAFQLDVGGLIWINPELVSSVQRQGDGLVLVRLAAGQPQQVVQIRGDAADVVKKLCEPDEVPVFDRRNRTPAPAPEPHTGGLFGAGLAGRTT